jgi:trans-AT polyketide synthase/acyltransferase/oxidoreductase domain-containing protein
MSLGAWNGARPAARSPRELAEVCRRFREPVTLVRGAAGGLGAGVDGTFLAAGGSAGEPVVGVLPPLYPEWLGDRSFTAVHGLRFPYVTGAMANGIATPGIVVAMARSGMLGFLGTAGRSHPSIAERLTEVEAALGSTGLSWGANLIHSPHEPELEMGTVEMFLQRGVVRAEASAYMGLNAMIVRYAFSGVRRGPGGEVVRKNFVFAKISRPEVARRFMSPPPAEILDGLVRAGHLTAEEAALARTLPVAEDVTVESDSGGHTDNRPLGSLFPDILFVRDECVRAHGRPIRVGAAGGLGTPASVASAFALGAAYVLTGSVNQGCVESGLSAQGRELLAKAGIADVAMAPAADMFELGVKVQVLKRGTMFAARALRLYEVYVGYPSLDAIPADERARLEKEIFQASLDEIWRGTEAFFAKRDPRENVKAQQDPKHKMALVFRWYLGLSSRWAIAGDAPGLLGQGRRMDFQIWCGPAQGAFNDWVKGTFLEPPAARTVVQVAANLLEGACVITRAHQLRTAGLPVPPEAYQFAPRPLEL